MANRNYGDRGGEERNRDWQSGQGDESWSQGGYGRFGQGGQRGSEGSYGGGMGGYGSQSGFSGQGDRSSQGGYGNQGGYGSQASQYGYSSGGGYTGQQSQGQGQQWQQGPHTGRGPQGYQRSNERIKEEVCETLTRHGHVDASGITVEVNNGEVTLTGTVNSRREKRMAEECIEELSGVRDVHNQLRVADRGDNGGGQEDLGSEATGVQPSQSARGSSTASGTSSASGTQNTSESSKSRRRT